MCKVSTGLSCGVCPFVSRSPLSLGGGFRGEHYSEPNAQVSGARPHPCFSLLRSRRRPVSAAPGSSSPPAGQAPAWIRHLTGVFPWWPARPAATACVPALASPAAWRDFRRSVGAHLSSAGQLYTVGAPQSVCLLSHWSVFVLFPRVLAGGGHYGWISVNFSVQGRFRGPAPSLLLAGTWEWTPGQQGSTNFNCHVSKEVAHF